MRWIYRNLLPEYRQQIKSTDFTDIQSLTRAIREYEILLKELGITPQQKVSRDNRNLTSIQTTHRQPENRPPIAPNSSRTPEANRYKQPRVIETPQGRQREETAFPPNRDLNDGRSYGRQPRPMTVERSCDIMCWRCGEKGHLRTQCRSEARLFCSRCGKQGVMSRDCPCQPSEN